MSAWRQLWALAAKDLRRRLSSPLPTLLQLLFPLIFAGLIALVFGPGEAKAPKIRLLIEDRDGGLVGMLVGAAFGQGEAAQYFDVVKVTEVQGDGSNLLEKEDAAALLRLPSGLTDAVLAGRPATLGLVQSPAQSILPQVAEQVVSVLAEALSAASRAFRAPLDKIQGVGGRPTDGQVAEVAVLVNQALSGSGGGTSYLVPPVVTLATTVRPEPAAKGSAPAGSPGRGSVFLFMLPGIAVFALFNLADQSMRDLLVEARLKTLRRQLAGPLGAGRLVAGKALATALVAGLSLVSISLVGALARWLGPARAQGVSLVGFAGLSFAVVLAATGFSSFLFAAARSEKQGATLASLLTLLMAFAGGAFVPSGSLPGALKAMAPASLIYWAREGYQKLVLDGAGWREVLPHLAVLAAAGAVLLALSGPLWTRRLRRGELA